MRSEVGAGPGLIDQLLKEAAQIEDLPDKVARPVVLNMFGLVLSSFHEALPKGVDPGKLLSGYVARLSALQIFGMRSVNSRPLITALGSRKLEREQ